MAASDAVNKMSSEFVALLGREDIDKEFIKKLAEVGITTVSRFAALVSDAEEMRELLKDEFDMDAKKGTLVVKAKVAAILAIWSKARMRSIKQAEAEGGGRGKERTEEASFERYSGHEEGFRGEVLQVGGGIHPVQGLPREEDGKHREG